jgi:hypothetical protein
MSHPRKTVKALGNIERPKQLKFNKMSERSPYNSNHRDALSDGDEFGKGLYKNSIGGKTDIKTRNKNLGSNKFGSGRGYRLED